MLAKQAASPLLLGPGAKRGLMKRNGILEAKICANGSDLLKRNSENLQSDPYRKGWKSGSLAGPLVKVPDVLLAGARGKTRPYEAERHFRGKNLVIC